jgi:predicted Zn-dependent protease
MTLTEQEVRAVFESAFEAASADEVELSMAWYHETNREVVCGSTKVIRFSNSYIRDDTVVMPCHPLQVHVAFGNREGSAITNQLDPAGVRDAVGRAEAIARVATPNESHRPPRGPEEYPEIPGFDEATAALTDEERHEAVAGVIERLQAEGLNGSGYFHVDDTLEAHANSAGAWFHRRATKTGYAVTVRSDDTTGRESSRIGSGWAAVGDLRRFADLDIPGITDIAIRKALGSVDPQPFEMGPHTVVLEPNAAASFIGLLMSAWSGARTVGAWGSPAEIGTEVASQHLNLSTQPGNPQIMGSPYGPGGMPLGERTWVENGVLRNLPGGENGPAVHLVGDGGSKSLEEVIAGVDRGILMTQNWNTMLRTIDPPHVNGMTRNGLFRIEDGQLAEPLQNAWYSLRLDELAQNIEDASRPYKTGTFGSSGLNGNLMPALRVADFNFYRPSEAV